MAIMYPKNLAAYDPTESERYVFEQLRDQLSNKFEVFYSYSWSYLKNDGSMKKSEADFIIIHPEYGYMCIEVKGGTGISIKDNVWHLDTADGGRDLSRSPYEQAEDSMYFLKDMFRKLFNTEYKGTIASAVMFPNFSIEDSEFISNRNKEITIDFSDMNILEKRIIQIFKIWGKSTIYDTKINPGQYHDSLIYLIKKKTAIAAAAGSLIEIKNKQFELINRVQDNYVSFLTNVRQFYIKGSAGTGKTWLVIKFANLECENNNDVLVVAKSKRLINMMSKKIDSRVDVLDVDSLFNRIKDDDYILDTNYTSLSDHVKFNVKKYDAIFVDEAQDFTTEMAYVIKLLLKDENQSRLGVFYDDVQIYRKDSFDNSFMINGEPYLLKENIRNTASIYDYASHKTNLGMDVILNPIEGPDPKIEKMRNYKELSNRLENLLKEYIVDEKVNNLSLTILTDDVEEFMEKFKDGIANWRFVRQNEYLMSNEIFVCDAFDFKGLESDMVIYIHNEMSDINLNYIAYTRAKYYLHEFII